MDGESHSVSAGSESKFAKKTVFCSEISTVVLVAFWSKVLLLGNGVRVMV